MTKENAQQSTGFESEALPHLDAVYRFALRLSGAPDLAEDLVQETFLRAFKSWGQYTTGTAAKSWLFTMDLLSAGSQVPSALKLLFVLLNYITKHECLWLVATSFSTTAAATLASPVGVSKGLPR